MNQEILNLCKNKTFKELFSAAIGKVYSNQIEFKNSIGSYSKFNTDFNQGILYLDSNQYKVQYIGTSSRTDNMWFSSEYETTIPDQYVDRSIKARKFIEQNGFEHLKLDKCQMSNEITDDKIAIIYTSVFSDVCYFKGTSGEVSLFMFIENLPNTIFEKIGSDKFIPRVIEIISNFDVNHKIMIKSFLINNGCTYEEQGNNVIAKFSENSIITFSFNNSEQLTNIDGQLISLENQLNSNDSQSNVNNENLNNNTTISNDINKKINVPSDFMLLNFSNTTSDFIQYKKHTDSAYCLARIYLEEKQKALPFDTNNIINKLHNVLTDDKGLVEVKSGITKNGGRYVYYIIKKQKNSFSMEYDLLMNIDINDELFCVQTKFSEEGITGKRDSVILNDLANKGIVSLPDMNGWFRDPYDENHKKGLLMNLSEKEEYDNIFPYHPLSELRRFIKYIIENN